MSEKIVQLNEEVIKGQIKEDVTESSLFGLKLYLSPILDLYSREILG